MNEKKQYCGLDLLKFIMAVLVAARHMIQVFYPAESRWRLVIGSWLSNLAVPVFFIIAGFLLFQVYNQLPALQRAYVTFVDRRVITESLCRVAADQKDIAGNIFVLIVG